MATRQDDQHKFTMTIIGEGGHKETYKGVCPANAVPPSVLDHIAMVFVEGEPETYAIEDPKCASDLIRFLTDRYEDAHVKIVGMYSRM